MKTKNTTKKSHLGFSIIEVLVAIGLMSVVSLALLAVLDSSNKGQKRAMNRDNLLNLTNQIRSTFTDSALCRQAFVFNVGNSTNFPTPPAANTKYALRRVTAFGRDLLLTNATVPGTTDISTPPTSSATGLRLELGGSTASATPGFTNWEATLVVPIVAVNQAAMRDITVTFLLTTDDATPSTIASCNAMATGTTEQSVCEGIMGGIYNMAQVPQCRLQQTLVSSSKHRTQLSAVPAGPFLAVETTAGSRGLASFGPGARIGLYPTEADFATVPANGVGLTIPANNQLQIDASQGILSDSYLHFTRAASGPSFALRLTNSLTSTDVFNLQRDGRLSVNTTQTGAWNNLGATSGADDILRLYDTSGTQRASVNATGDFGIGPSSGTGKLDVRGDAAGDILNWGLAGGVQGTLSANAGVVGISTAAGNALTIQSANSMAVSSSAGLTIASTGTTRIITHGGSNNLFFTATDADFNLNVNAPTFNNVSDRRLKSDIDKIENVLEKLIQVQSYSFVFKNDGEKKRHFGFIAQELQKTYPNLVQTTGSGYLSVNYIEVIPILVEALKESTQKNLELERRLARIENTVLRVEETIRRANTKDIK